MFHVSTMLSQTIDTVNGADEDVNCAALVGTTIEKPPPRHKPTIMDGKVRIICCSEGARYRSSVIEKLERGWILQSGSLEGLTWDFFFWFFFF
jgi:hypothetical protein